MSLNGALQTAGSAIQVFSTGISVAGNNISNASTPGYIREQLGIAEAAPSKQGNLLIGNGVVTTGIQQQLDKYLQQRIQGATSEFEGADTRNTTYKQLETVLQSLGDSSLPNQLSGFLNSINDLASQPESGGLSQLAVQQGVQFASSVQSLRQQVDSLRTAADGQVVNLVSAANGLLDQIQSLNAKIVSTQAGTGGKNDAGALLSQRYQALTQLSQIIPVQTTELPNSTVEVFAGSEPLVQGGTVQHLATVTTKDRGLAVHNVVVQADGYAITGTQGQLNGLTYARDNVIGGFEDNLDTYTSNLINHFNLTYSSGQGQHGFTTVTSAGRVSDPTTPLNASGLAFPPTQGTFDVKVIDQSTGAAQTSTISVNVNGIGAQTSLNDISTQLNGVANISSSVNSDGRLVINAGPGFQIQFANDNSGTLASLGINTFFTGSDSTNIGVNAAVAADSTLFASGTGGGPGDGSNAVALAQIADTPVSGLQGSSISQFYDGTITSLAQASASESALADGYQGFRDTLVGQQTQLSGVSLDEEAIKILQFQHSYQAAAKFISTIDQLFTTLINI